MLRFIILLPVLLLLIVFAASNPQSVTLGLWPLSQTVTAPLSVATLVIACLFYVIGALAPWLRAVGARMRAGRAERRARSLQAVVSRLESRLAANKKGASAATR